MPGTGLLLVRDVPDSLWLLSMDADYAIHTSHWSPACDWSPWRQVIAGSTATRTGLSGTHEVVPGATGPMVGLVWTLEPAIDQTFVEAAAVTLPSTP